MVSYSSIREFVSSFVIQAVSNISASHLKIHDKVLLLPWKQISRPTIVVYSRLSVSCSTIRFPDALACATPSNQRRQTVKAASNL